MFLAFSFEAPVAPAALRRTARRINRFVPACFADVPVIWIAQGRRQALLHWPRRDEPATERLSASPAQAVALDGYLSSADPGRSMAATLANRLLAGPISGSGGAGGVAAMVQATPEGLRLWTTQPPHASIYYATGALPDAGPEGAAPACALAGTRPLLVHLALRGDNKPDLSQDRMALRLVAGSVLDHGTLFTGLRRLWPTRLLHLTGARAAEAPAPLAEVVPLPADMPAERQAEALAEALTQSVAAFRGGAVLMASGGKDSRTLAAACHAAGTTLQAVTYGPEGGDEAETARATLDRIGVTLDLRLQAVHADPLVGARATLLRTEGQIGTDCRQIAYAGPERFDRPVLHGNGHLLRGGAASTTRFSGLPDDPNRGSMSPAAPRSPETPDLMRAIEANFISGWIKPGPNEQSRAVLADWRASRPVSDPREWVYFVHHDFRLAVHAAPAMLDTAGVNRMIYPLLDENVIALSNRLSFEDRVLERTLFRAIRQMAPALTELPLFGEMWRFEQAGPVEGFPGRHMRVTTQDKAHLHITRSGLRRIGTGSGRPMFADAAVYLRDSPTWPALRDLMTDRMVAVVESMALTGQLPEAELARAKPSQDSAIRKLAEAFGLAVHFDEDWCAPTRRSPPLEAFQTVQHWGQQG